MSPSINTLGLSRCECSPLGVNPLDFASLDMSSSDNTLGLSRSEGSPVGVIPSGVALPDMSPLDSSPDTSRSDSDLSETDDYSSAGNSDEPLKPLNAEQCFNTILLANPENILPKIPIGPKNNINYVIRNLQPVGKQKHRVYPDDCGPWNSKKGTTVNMHFEIRDDLSLRLISFRKGEFCVAKKVKKKSIWVPLQPQPEPTRILKMHRYYTSLTRKDDYKKRVTWFEFPDCMADVHDRDLAIVEYIGTYPEERACHGNCRKNFQNHYIRADPTLTSTDVDDKITAKANDLYTALPKDIEQIRNTRKRQKRAR